MPLIKKPCQYVRLTSTGVVRGYNGILVGMIVAITSSGTITFWDNATGATVPQITGTITPSAGTYISLGDVCFQNGCWAVITGTLDVTIAIQPQ